MSNIVDYDTEVVRKFKRRQEFLTKTVEVSGSRVEVFACREVVVSEGLQLNMEFAQVTELPTVIFSALNHLDPDAEVFIQGLEEWDSEDEWN